MKRWIGLIGGVAAGVLLTGVCLLSAAWLWPRLVGRLATPASTSVDTTPVRAAPTLTPTPTAAPLPAEVGAPTPEAPFLREVRPTSTRTSVPSSDPRLQALPITRLELQTVYEVYGFAFEQTFLADGRDRWVAASPDGLALVEIIGAEAVMEASVTVFGPISQSVAGGPQRAVYMVAMMEAILPGWTEGAVWFSDALVRAARQSGDYQSATSYSDVRVQLTFDAQLGAIILSFEPD